MSLNNWKVGLLSGLAGMFIGIIMGFAFDNGLEGTLKKFEQGNLEIIREDNLGGIGIGEYKFGLGNIYVQNSDSTYVSLKKYLESIENKYDRKIKESEIKKLVGW